jgi:ubiquinone/menaquinone biosynthesis C-methylase UbiE/uncharacterized protein YbaR (Trm112 family)
MQIRVLEKLICPLCAAYPLEIQVFTYYRNEIVEDGILICRDCKSWFSIIDRLLELVPQQLTDLETRDSFFKKYSKKFNDLGIENIYQNKSNNSDYSEQINQQEHFNWYAENKDQTYLEYEKTPFWRGVDKLIFDRWRRLIEPDKWLLDVGCAQGRSTFNVIDLNIQVVGFDISKKMVQQLIKRADKEGYSDRTSFFVADASALPFCPEVFDYVLIYGVLHHLPEPGETMKDVNRVLKSGGRLFSLENNKTVFRGIFDLLMKLKPIWFEEAGQEPLISNNMISQWVKDLSLKVNTRTSIFIPPHIVNYFSNKIAFKIIKITDILANCIPFLKNQGGIIIIDGKK